MWVQHAYEGHDIVHPGFDLAFPDPGLLLKKPDYAERRSREIRQRALDLFDRFDHASTSIIADAASQLSADDVARLDAALPALERLRDVLVGMRNTDIAPGSAAEHPS